MKSLTTKYGTWAVMTCAPSGIGKSFAYRFPYQDHTASCSRIPVLANEWGDGAFQGSLRGISGHQKWVETGENDAK